MKGEEQTREWRESIIEINCLKMALRQDEMLGVFGYNLCQESITTRAPGLKLPFIWMYTEYNQYNTYSARII